MNPFFPKNPPTMARFGHAWHRWWQLAAIVSHLQPQESSPKVALAQQGLEPAGIRQLLRRTKNLPEPVLARWDQDNRILLGQGIELPFLEGIRVDKKGFVPRQRNQLDLVLYRGQPAIRKRFRQ